MTYAYHRGTIHLPQVGAFIYVVPSVLDDGIIIICIDLILPMGWVDSAKFFCTFSETLTYLANALVDANLPVPAFQAIYVLSTTEPVPPHTPESLTHIDCYIDDVIYAVQRGEEQQH